MPTTSCLLSGHKCETSDCLFFIPSHQVFIFIYWWDFPEASLLHAEQSVFLTLSCYDTSSIPLIISVALLWLYSGKFMSVLYWQALDSVLQIWPHQPWVSGPPPAGSTFPNAALETADFFCHNTFPASRPALLSAVTCRSLSALSVVSVGHPPAWTDPLIPPQVNYFALPSSELQEVTLIQCIQRVLTAHQSASPPSFVLYLNSLKVHSAPPPRSLKRHRPLCWLLEHTTSDLLPTGLLAADHIPLDLAVQQFLIHLSVCLSSLYFVRLLMRILRETASTAIWKLS